MTQLVLRIGTLDGADVFCSVQDDGKRLSFTGVVGPLSNGDAKGSCGQIMMGFSEYDKRGYQSLEAIKPASGWSKELIKKFFDAWRGWHLNDMRAECTHQRALGWTYEDHHGDWVEYKKTTKNLVKYAEIPARIEMTAAPQIQSGLSFYRQAGDGLEVYDEFAGHKCPECGYRIGSAWLFEPVPEDVIEFLNSLPAADKVPAWV